MQKRKAVCQHIFWGKHPIFSHIFTSSLPKKDLKTILVPYLSLDDLTNPLTPFFQGRLIAPFDEQPGFRLRSRISQEHASPLCLKLRFGLGQEPRHVVHFLEGLLLAYYNIRNQLRKACPALRQF